MGIKLFIIFIVALTIDNLILSALFGFRNSLLTILVILLLILYLGPGKQSVCFGLFFSIISESFRGLGFGTLAVPFLLTMVVIYLARKFLDIKYTYDMRFGLGRSIILALMLVAVTYLFSIFYVDLATETRLPRPGSARVPLGEPRPGSARVPLGERTGPFPGKARFLSVNMWDETSIRFFDPVIGLTILSEALALILVFNIALNKRDYF